MSERKVTLSELAAGIELPAGEEHVLTVAVHDRAEIEDAFFHHDSAFFLPDAPEREPPPGGDATATAFSNTGFWQELQRFHPKFSADVQQPYDPEGDDSSGGRREGVPLILAVLHYAEARPNRRMLVAGHTDTVGDAAYNEKLSGRRAVSVVALVEGQREAFVGAVQDKRNPKDDAVMLRYVARTRGWPCDVPEGKAASTTQIKAFQTQYNDVFGAAGKAKLTVDGVAGPKTLGAYFDVMEDDLARQAGGAEALASLRGKVAWVDASHKTLACGERYPVAGQGLDGFDSQTNRRVEVLGFHPSDLPDLSAPDAADGLYAKQLHFLRPLSLATGGFVAAAAPTETAAFALAPAPAPPAGTGEPDPMLATEMPVRSEAADPADPWGFLEPLDESRTAIARSLEEDGADDTALA